METVGLLLVTGDRGLAGSFNSQIIRAGNAARASSRPTAEEVVLVRLGPPRRVVAPVPRLRGNGRTRASPTARRTRTPARSPTRGSAYVDGEVDRVEVIYNHYISHDDAGGLARDAAPAPAGRRSRRDDEDEDDRGQRR